MTAQKKRGVNLSASPEQPTLVFGGESSHASAQSLSYNLMMTCSAWPFSLHCFQFWKAQFCAFVSPALWSHPTSPSRALTVTLPARFSEEHVNPITPRFVRRSWSTEVNRLESLSAQTGSPGYAWQLRCATGSLPAPGSWERGKVRGKSRRKRQQQDLLWKKKYK